MLPSTSTGARENLFRTGDHQSIQQALLNELYMALWKEEYIKPSFPPLPNEDGKGSLAHSIDRAGEMGVSDCLTCLLLLVELNTMHGRTPKPSRTNVMVEVLSGRFCNR